jgi:hypothetical protein
MQAPEDGRDDFAYTGVMRLAVERPDWLPVVEAILKRARDAADYGGEFAGAWVLQDLRREGVADWLPNLRLLVSFGIIAKSGESTRGGQRAYYRMPDQAGVERALKRLARVRRRQSHARLGDVHSRIR